MVKSVNGYRPQNSISPQQARARVEHAMQQVRQQIADGFEGGGGRGWSANAAGQEAAVAGYARMMGGYGVAPEIAQQYARRLVSSFMTQLPAHAPVLTPHPGGLEQFGGHLPYYDRTHRLPDSAKLAFVLASMELQIAAELQSLLQQLQTLRTEQFYQPAWWLLGGQGDVDLDALARAFAPRRLNRALQAEFDNHRAGRNAQYGTRDERKVEAKTRRRARRRLRKEQERAHRPIDSRSRQLEARTRLSLEEHGAKGPTPPFVNTPHADRPTPPSLSELPAPPPVRTSRAAWPTPPVVDTRPTVRPEPPSPSDLPAPPPVRTSRAARPTPPVVDTRPTVRPEPPSPSDLPAPPPVRTSRASRPTPPVVDTRPTVRPEPPSPSDLPAPPPVRTSRASRPTPPVVTSPSDRPIRRPVVPAPSDVSTRPTVDRVPGQASRGQELRDLTQSLQRTVDGNASVSAAQIDELRALTSQERVEVLNGLGTWPDVQKLGRKIAAHPEEAGGLIAQLLNQDVQTDPKVAGALANRLILGVRDRGGNGHDNVYRQVEDQLAGGDVTEASRRQRAAQKLSVLPASTLDVMYDSHYRGNTDADHLPVVMAAKGFKLGEGNKAYQEKVSSNLARVGQEIANGDVTGRTATWIAGMDRQERMLTLKSLSNEQLQHLGAHMADEYTDTGHLFATLVDDTKTHPKTANAALYQLTTGVARDGDADNVLQAMQAKLGGGDVGHDAAASRAAEKLRRVETQTLEKMESLHVRGIDDVNERGVIGRALGLKSGGERGVRIAEHLAQIKKQLSTGGKSREILERLNGMPSDERIRVLKELDLVSLGSTIVDYENKTGDLMAKMVLDAAGPTNTSKVNLRGFLDGVTKNDDDDDALSRMMRTLGGGDVTSHRNKMVAARALSKLPKDILDRMQAIAYEGWNDNASLAVIAEARKLR